MRQKLLKVKHAFVVDVAGQNYNDFFDSLLLHTIFQKQFFHLFDCDFLVWVASDEPKSIFDVH